MYSHTFFVTSVRANHLAPQIAAKASLRLFFENALAGLLHGKRVLLGIVRLR